MTGATGGGGGHGRGGAEEEGEGRVPAGTTGRVATGT